MRKLLIFAAMVAMLLVALAPVAFADNKDNNDQLSRQDVNQLERDLNRFDNRFNDNFFGDQNPAFVQSNDQDVSSGDAHQSINVVGGGDNSNQCAGVQGVVNTGNSTNSTQVLQYGNDDAGVSVKDSGNFTISPSNSTSCDQQVNQAASAA